MVTSVQSNVYYQPLHRLCVQNSLDWVFIKINEAGDSNQNKLPPFVHHPGDYKGFMYYIILHYEGIVGSGIV